MSGTVNLLVGLAMGLNLIALASSRLPSIIRAAALQGMVLGVLPFLLKPDFHWLVALVAVGTITVKGFVIPSLLRRALRAASIDREVEPIIGYIPSLLLGATGKLGNQGRLTAAGFAGHVQQVIAHLEGEPEVPAVRFQRPALRLGSPAGERANLRGGRDHPRRFEVDHPKVLAHRHRAPPLEREIVPLALAHLAEGPRVDCDEIFRTCFPFARFSRAARANGCHRRPPCWPLMPQRSTRS